MLGRTLTFEVICITIWKKINIVTFTVCMRISLQTVFNFITLFQDPHHSDLNQYWTYFSLSLLTLLHFLSLWQQRTRNIPGMNYTNFDSIPPGLYKKFLEPTEESTTRVCRVISVLYLCGNKKIIFHLSSTASAMIYSGTSIQH